MTANSEPTEIWPDLLDRLRRDPGVAAFVQDHAAVLLFSADGRHVVHANQTGLALAAAGFAAATMRRLEALRKGLRRRVGSGLSDWNSQRRQAHTR